MSYGAAKIYCCLLVLVSFLDVRAEEICEAPNLLVSGDHGTLSVRAQDPGDADLPSAAATSHFDTQLANLQLCHHRRYQEECRPALRP